MINTHIFKKCQLVLDSWVSDPMKVSVNHVSSSSHTYRITTYRLLPQNSLPDAFQTQACLCCACCCPRSVLTISHVGHSTGLLTGLSPSSTWLRLLLKTQLWWCHHMNDQCWLDQVILDTTSKTFQIWPQTTCGRYWFLPNNDSCISSFLSEP